MLYRADIPMQHSYTKPLPLHFHSAEFSEGRGEMADEGEKVAMEYGYSEDKEMIGENKNETVIGIASARQFFEETFDAAEEGREKKKQRLMEPDSADNIEKEDIPNPKQSVEMAKDAEKTHVFQMEYVLEAEDPPGTPIEVDTKESTETEEDMLSDDNDNIDDEEEDKQEETSIDVETRLPVEGEPDFRDRNMVLRTLLRGPRYFKPTDWMTCYKCGEDYHDGNCEVKKKRKPCYICGELGHDGKRCKQVRKCFICSNKGHLSKDCPKDQPEEDRLCLKCGNSGHDMFSCVSEYFPKDLKNTQCYICKEFGHLCCVEYRSEGPRHVSCFRCGQLGHSGFECDMESKPLCSKCGGRGHQREECDKPLEVCGPYLEAGGLGNTENIPANKKSAKNRKKKKKKQPINVPQGMANGNTVWHGTQAIGQYFARLVSNVWLSPPPPVQLASNAYSNPYYSQRPRQYFNHHVGTQAPQNTLNYQADRPQIPHQIYSHQQTFNHQTRAQYPRPVFGHQTIPPLPQQNFNHHTSPRVPNGIYNHHPSHQNVQQLLNHWSQPQFPLQNFNHQTRPQAPH